MLISLNWLKKFVDIDVSNEELIRLIGARLVEVEGVINTIRYMLSRWRARNIFLTHI